MPVSLETLDGVAARKPCGLWPALGVALGSGWQSRSKLPCFQHYDPKAG